MVEICEKEENGPLTNKTEDCTCWPLAKKANWVAQLPEILFDLCVVC